MLSSKRIATFLALLCLVPFVASDRLSLTEGGYARVVSLQEYPLSSFTVSGWVNVTRFPEGIAPLITYLSEDVTSQLAFFLRPEGVGVLWGGPTIPLVEEELEGLPLVDRQPRAQWVDKQEQRRRKREAVDYSGGLGDIENILTKRSGLASKSWAPLNFVDVGEMGVDDLMLSGSDPMETVVENDEAHPHARVYSDWTNVPYELHMEESVGGREHYVLPDAEATPRREPTIITKPSGNDDFVYFNWNVPSGREPVNIPLGNNNWAPLWESTKENPHVNQLQRPEEGQKPGHPIVTIPKRKQTGAVTEESHRETTHSNKWDAVNLNAEIYESPPFKTKLLPTKVERPIWPSSNTSPQPHTSPDRVASIPPKPNNNLRHRYKPHVPQSLSNNVKIQRLHGVEFKDRLRLRPSPLPPPPPSTPQALPEITTKTTILPRTTTTPTTTPPTTTTTTTPKTTTTLRTTTRRPPLLPRRNIIPALYRYNKKRKNTTIKPRQEIKEPEIQKPTSAVVPLWKRIKKTQKEDDPQHRLPTNLYSKSPVFALSAYTKPFTSITTEKTPLFKKIRHSFPEPTLPPINPSKNKEPLQGLASVRRNIYYRSRPVQSIAKRPPTTTIRTTTTVPTTTSKRILYRPTIITQKVPNYQSYKAETSTVRVKPSYSELGEAPKVNYQRKQNEPIPTFQRNKYTYAKVNEFEKAMQDPQLIKEGNTAIVYAVPITNEKEFYEMYKKYQRDSMQPSKSTMNLHELYNEMRTGGIRTQGDTEEEINANGIKESKISLYETNNYPTNIKYDLVEQNVAHTTATTTAATTTTVTTTPMTTTQTTTITTTDAPIIREEATSTSQRSDIPIQDDLQDKQENTDKVESDPLPATENANYDDFYVYDDRDEPLNIYDNPVYDYYTTNDEEEIVDLSTASPVLSEGQTVNNEANDASDTDYYESTQQEFDDNIALEDLYRPNEATSINGPQIAPSHYQEQQTLYLDQLPPQYQKPEKQYDFKETTSTATPDKLVPTSTSPALDKEFHPNPIYSSNPLDLLSQGLIPKPIHVVDSQAEADEWMRRHHSSPPSPFLLVEGQASGPVVIPPHSLPSPLPPADQQPAPLDEITQIANPSALNSPKLPLDIHFEKIAYPFNENTWYHIALTWNTRTKRATIYVNGERIGIIENVLQREPHMKEGGLFLIGKTLLPDLSDFDDSSQFVGEISDLNMWATELSPLTMDAVFQCKYEPVSPQPINWQRTELKLYDEAAMTPSPPLCGLVT